MRFHIANTNGHKRRAKLLKRFLNDLGYDKRLHACQELMAKMLGYRNHQELCALAGTLPLSEGDALVDEETREARRRHQIGILLAAGIDAEHAALAVDEIQPTGYIHGNPNADQTRSSPSDDLDAAFEQEWGLRGSNRTVTMEIRRSRPAFRSRS